MRNIIFVLLLLLSAANAVAAVWRVEKDGTGDFTIIQQAVDASASGDTILIGPGRYDDKFLWGNPPWQQYTRVLVTRADLTLIGAGADQTIIGSAVPLGIGYSQDSGLAAHVALGGGALRVSLIGFENCYRGAYFVGLESAIVVDCRFAGSGNSVASTNVDDLIVESCNFESVTSVDSFASHLAVWGPGRFTLLRSSLAISKLHNYAWSHVRLQQISAARIVSCQFEGGAIGLNMSGGSGTGDLIDCRFVDQHNAGIAHAVAHGTIRVANTTMQRQYKALWSAEVNPRWEVDGLIVEDAFEYSLVFSYLGDGYIRNSQLARGMRYVVRDAGVASSDVVVHFDMTNNWWGTTEPDSIQSWIFDGNDQPERPYYFIDWMPFRSGPVGTEERSFGGVKSMFR
jgi:hypothetical protein